MHLCMYIRTYVYVCSYIYMDVCCMHSARTGYIYECVCTGYIYECIPHAHAHACIHARIHSYLGRLGSALSSERPPVLVLLRCFSSHPVLNRHLCVCGVQPWSSQRIFARRYACATGFMSARTDFKHEVTAERGSLRRPQAWTLEFGAWKPNKFWLSSCK